MRDVLVAVCGLTPQVVTETLWALYHRTPPIHPAEVWILTTQAGRKACRDKLLGANRALVRFVREYRPRPVPRCPASQVIVLKGADGRPLDDVRSEFDNRAIADQIAAFIRQQTERPDVRLHCSVAGGRKTMGVLLASALQLFGRAEDRLYHVLVSPELERKPQFFYPTRAGRATGAARIELADIPYVRLRSLLPSETLTADPPFTELVRRAERELTALTSPEPLTIVGRHTSHPQIAIGIDVVEMRPDAARLYTAFARVKAERCTKPDRPTCEGCSDCYVALASHTWDQARVVLEPLAGSGQLPSSVEPVRSLISRAHKAIAKALGSHRIARTYFVQGLGPRTEKRYGLVVDKTQIRIES